MPDQKTIDTAVAKIEAARKELERAKKKASRVIANARKSVQAEIEKEEMTVALAMEADFGDHALDNEAGHRWLVERCYGEWAGSGISVYGTSRSTGQFTFSVSVKPDASSEELDRTAKIIEQEILPVMRPGVFRNQPKMGKFSDYRVIEVKDDDCFETHHFCLLISPEGEVQLLDIRYYHHSDVPIYVGDIRGALNVIKKNLPHT